MTPNEALVKCGMISSPQRGRLSKEKVNKLNELVGEGWNIEGYSSATAKPLKKTYSKPTLEESSIQELVPETRPEKEYQAKTSLGEVGMRTVCNNCRISLTHCPCHIPNVWVNNNEVPVNFIPRTTPLSNRWW